MMTTPSLNKLTEAQASLPELFLCDIQDQSYESAGGYLRSISAQVCVKFPAGLSYLPVRVDHHDSGPDYSGIICSSHQAFLFQKGKIYYVFVEFQELGQGHHHRQLTHVFLSDGQSHAGQIPWRAAPLPQERPESLTTARTIHALEKTRIL
jgi:hypothetical protein